MAKKTFKIALRPGEAVQLLEVMPHDSPLQFERGTQVTHLVLTDENHWSLAVLCKLRGIETGRESLEPQG